MYFTDILILLCSFLLLVGLRLESPERNRRGTILLLVILGLSLTGHFALDRGRWQMVPAYVVAGVAALLSAWRLRRSEVLVRRRWVRVSATVGAIILILIAIVPPAALPVFDAPDPTGPFAVGVRNVHLVDSSRQDPFSQNPADRRELMVRVWYPAARSNCTPLPYLSANDAADMSATLINGRDDPKFLLNHLSKISSGACAGLPLAPGAQYPALLFSHGWGGYISQNSVLMEDLASYGYVVVSVAHPGDAGAVRFPGGRVYPFKRDEPENPAVDREMSALAQAMDKERDPIKYRRLIQRIIELIPSADEAMRLWAIDNSFVIDSLEKNGLGLPAAQLDLSRIGVFGHSLGGAAAAQTCLFDKRCKAAINLDGMQFGDLGGRELNIPFLMYYLDPPNQGILYNDAMYRTNPGEPGKVPLEFVVHKNTKHNDGSEMTLLLSPLFKSFVPNPLLGPTPGREVIRVQEDIIRAFFDEQLKGRPGALRAAITRHPGVITPWKVHPINRKDGRHRSSNVPPTKLG